MSVKMDAKRQDAIIAVARTTQALEDADRVLENVMVQTSVAGLGGIVDQVAEMKQHIARWRYSAFTAWLPPLSGTFAGAMFEDAQKEEEKP